MAINADDPKLTCLYCTAGDEPVLSSGVMGGFVHAVRHAYWQQDEPCGRSRDLMIALLESQRDAMPEWEFVARREAYGY